MTIQQIIPNYTDVKARISGTRIVDVFFWALVEHDDGRREITGMVLNQKANSFVPTSSIVQFQDFVSEDE